MINGQEISDALGTDYVMFYNPSVSIDILVPRQTLAGCISTVNQQLAAQGKNLSSWPSGFQDEIARLVWVNWIYHQLDVEPIRKPVLVHKENNQLVVDCGDTRLMAMQLLDNPPTVSVVVTCVPDRADDYSNWKQIHTNQDLIECVEFDPSSSQIFFTPTDPGESHAFTWLEIGDQSTSHHLHNVDQRVQMMQNYLDSQSQNVEFTLEWAKSRIEWV
jgi:hypothetical protein